MCDPSYIRFRVAMSKTLKRFPTLSITGPWLTHLSSNSMNSIYMTPSFTIWQLFASSCDYTTSRLGQCCPPSRSQDVGCPVRKSFLLSSWRFQHIYDLEFSRVERKPSVFNSSLDNTLSQALGQLSNRSYHPPYPSLHITLSRSLTWLQRGDSMDTWWTSNAGLQEASSRRGLWLPGSVSSSPNSLSASALMLKSVGMIVSYFREAYPGRTVWTCLTYLSSSHLRVSSPTIR